MEALGAASAVLAFVEFSAALAAKSLKYLSAVRDAKEDVKRLEVAVGFLGTLFESASKLAKESGAAQLRSTIEFVEGGGMDECDNVMLKLKEKLKPREDAREMRRFGRRALLWPFKSEEVAEMLVILGACKDSFSLALDTDIASLMLLNRHEDEERRQSQFRSDIIRFLLDFDSAASFSNHEDARKKHDDETGEWLLHSDAFSAWTGERGRGQILWVSGIPGCGKTIMISSIIEHLLAHARTTDGVALGYFYFDFRTATKQNVLYCARYMLAGLLQCQETISPRARAVFAEKLNSQKQPKLEEVTEMIGLVSNDFKDMYLVLDSLDEIPRDNSQRSELLDWLTNIRDLLAARLHLCCSSRREEDIVSAFDKLSNLVELPMDAKHVAEDIKLYLQHSFETHATLKNFTPELKQMVSSKLLDGSGGMFRWVECQLDVLKRCHAKKQVVNALKTLPKTLFETYERILLAIPEQDVEYARRALWWIMRAQRPLKVEEVAEAAIIEVDDPTPFDEENRLFGDPTKGLLKILRSLVVVVPINELILHKPIGGKRQVRSALVNSIRLSHLSVQDFLVNHIQESSNARLRSFWLSDVSAYISTCSLHYLFHYIEDEDRAYTSEDRARFPLLLYSARFWARHLSRASDRRKLEGATELATKLLQSPELRSRWLRLYNPFARQASLYYNPRYRGSLLHYAAALGMVNVAKNILDARPDDVDCRDWHHDTPLHRAAQQSQLEMMELLIERGAEVDAQDSRGKAALHILASEYMYGTNALDVAEILLSAEADPNLTDCYGQSTLFYVCLAEDLNLAQLLLKDKSDPSVKEVLERIQAPRRYIPSVNVNHRDANGDTTLHVMATIGSSHRDIEFVKLLLEHGININAVNNDGENALHAAIGYKETLSQAKITLVRAEIIDLLIKHGIDVNVADKHGSTVSHRFAMMNSTEGIETMVSLGRVNFDAADKDGNTPLDLALYALISRLEPFSHCESGRKVKDMDELQEHAAIIEQYVERDGDYLRSHDFRKSMDIIRVLLLAGAQPTISKRNAHLPRHVAKTWETLEVAVMCRMLEEARESIHADAVAGNFKSSRRRNSIR